jgi:hypothetical protein
MTYFESKDVGWKQVKCPKCKSKPGECCGKIKEGAFYWVRTAPHTARKNRAMHLNWLIKMRRQRCYSQNADHQPPGHKAKNEKEKALFPVGLDEVVRSFVVFIYYRIQSVSNALSCGLVIIAKNLEGIPFDWF